MLKGMLSGETVVTKSKDKANLLEEQYQSKYNVMQVLSCDKECCWKGI
jgi:hypothetical protein